jgi:hypothetical protein
MGAPRVFRVVARGRNRRGRSLKILLVLAVDPWTRSVATVHHWLAAGRAAGHDIAVFGEPNPELPDLKYTLDLAGTDVAVFAVQLPGDFPDMPHLARLLDGVPREKRVVADLWAKYNNTTFIEHDFNHLEKFDTHLGWEWLDAIGSVAGKIVQPTLAPLKQEVGSFLFHGFNPDAVVKPHKSARDAASAWSKKPYGVMYVGSNWQRWTQMSAFLESYGKARAEIGRACLVGWDWAKRPDWAVQNGIMGIDADPALLERLHIEVRNGVRFDAIPALLGEAKFAPVLHRPLFRHLGFVTNRSFETFHADTIPLLMLPKDFVQAVYGEAALALVPGDDPAGLMLDALKRPEHYWDAVLQTRAHLAKHHSYARRLEELAALAKTPARAGASR